MTDSPLAWARHLPPDEIRSMLLEVSRTAEQAFGGNPHEVLAETDTVLAARRSTAQASADPELYAALTTPIDLIDLVDAPRPEAARFVFAGRENGSHDCLVRYDGYGSSLVCSCACHIDHAQEGQL